MESATDFAHRMTRGCGASGQFKAEHALREAVELRDLQVRLAQTTELEKKLAEA